MLAIVDENNLVHLYGTDNEVMKTVTDLRIVDGGNKFVVVDEFGGEYPTDSLLEAIAVKRCNTVYEMIKVA